MSYNKQVLFGLCIAMVFVNVFVLETDLSFPNSIYPAIGASIISIPIWILIGGFIIFNFILAIINFIKPENDLKIEHWDRANAGLIIGIILKMIFGLQI